ncbi:MAG: response regulator [Burkholderiaceae bacterium]|nr:response regulator [Burkholderiaceae bacterium]
MAQPESDALLEDLCGTVLCIEDDPLSRTLVEEMLSAFPSVTLRQAVNGHDGICAALEEMPDVILLDMNMPDMRGLEVVRVLSNRIADGSCHVILLTAERFSIDVVKAMSLGAREHWPKPLSEDKLQGGLRRILRAPQRQSTDNALPP